MINVVVVEDNKNIREGLKILIDSKENYSCSAGFSDCEGMFKDLKNLKIDVLLIDIGLPGMNGIEGIKQIRNMLPDVPILVLTVYEENEMVFDALRAGACGYLEKKTPSYKLFDVINEAYNGGALMSAHIARKVLNFFKQSRQNEKVNSSDILNAQEKKILGLLVEGRSSKAIADELDISAEKVSVHFKNIYNKLHLRSYLSGKTTHLKTTV